MVDVLSGTLSLFENTYNELGFPASLDGGAWDLINTCEGLAGSLLIATGVTMAVASGIGIVPLLAIGAGSLSCFAAAPSIIMSLTPGVASAKITNCWRKYS